MRKLIPLITLMLSVILCSTYAFASDPEIFSGGTGTEGDPYKISSSAQLDNIRNYPDAYFILSDDITFTEEDFSEGGDFYNNGELWIPIGNIDEPFTGNFDGDGKKITGLKINMNVSTDAYAGLFGVMDSAAVTGVNMRSCDIIVTGRDEVNEWTCIYAGSIAGLIKNTTIGNCSNTGNITVSSAVSLNRVGGIVGGMDDGSTITTSYNSGKITASSTENVSTAGGIAGDINDSTVSDSYNSGNIKASAANETYAFSGGIAGEISSLSGISSSILFCYNSGSIVNLSSGSVDIEPAHGSASGIVNSCLYSSVANCYSIDSVTACVGSDDSQYPTVNVYTAEEMLSDSNFAYFDFENTWLMGDGNKYSYPTLKSVAHEGIEITGIELTTPPQKTKYVENDEFDPTGGNITVTYSDDSTDVIDLLSEYVSGFDSSAPAELELTVTYLGQTTSFNVTVDHDYYNVLVDATCTEDGGEYTRCNQCDYEYVDPLSIVPATGHREESIPDEDPTCTDPGHIGGISCQDCGETLEPQEEVPPLGHDYVLSVDYYAHCYINTCGTCGDVVEVDQAETVDIINLKLDELAERELSLEDEELVNELIAVCKGVPGAEEFVTNYDKLEIMNRRFILHNEGDIDFDGIIKAADLSILLFYYNTDMSESDLNGDKIVNNADLSALLYNYGNRV